MAKRKRGKDDAHRRAPPPAQQQQKKKKAKLANVSSTPAAHHQAGTSIPFDPSDRILLIGEGDFSFAASLVEHHACHSLTATSLDTRTELLAKYAPQAEEHIRALEEAGQTVLYNVDATKLERNKAVIRAAAAANHGEEREAEGFDKILFNFPHIGGKSTDVNRQVRANQELLVAFFASCTSNTSPPLLASRVGQILITLFDGLPYTLWNIRDLARHSGLEVERSFKFDAGLFPGYRHARTLGNLVGEGGWRGEERGARTYVFRRKGVGAIGKGGKRKRGSEDEDEEGPD